MINSFLINFPINFPINEKWLIAIALNTILGAIALTLPRKVLTTAGICHAWGLGIIIWGCLGWQGYTVILSYLIVGSGVTRIGKEIKEAKGIAEKRDGARGPENLWGSAATGAVCAIAQAIVPNPIWLLAYVASLSTKLADTTASEIGKAYGKSTFLITTLKPVAAGTEGAVSLEGTIAGVMGSLLIAVIGWAVGLLSSPWSLLWCAIAAFIATNIESLIGATLQNKYDWLTNELVNGINTTIGAAIAILIAQSLHTFNLLLI
ncbi:TIGR00297 family protein [Pseudanabaena sp. 'Roaring Creek']|uniref:TIGR00297 family protein n=1 Tax=Pseudanabaena sp. 'Roaring Creek' TaxID=1681830 RepID=UPI0006D858A1|nr:TIGR00297 family protein [Pseudanabaena sp. 'Roaring Creek']